MTEAKNIETSSTLRNILSIIQPFAFGGLSGMIGTCVIQPIDTIKVRIQIMGESGQVASTNPFKIGYYIFEKEGVSALYKGLDSALFR
jgi:solute carrier family 25 oxoglutarate transporter 11